MEEGGEGETCFEVEESYAFRALKLVGGGGDSVKATEVQWHFTQGLHGVGVEKDAALTAGFSDFLDRLDDAGLVVGGHE